MKLSELLPLSRPLIGFDLETTGTDTRTARIVEIAFIEHKTDGREKEWSTLLNPGIPIPRDASAVHHITDMDVASKPTFAQVAPHLIKGFAEADFYGFNVLYDLKVLAEEFKRVGIAFDYSKARVLDGFRCWQIGAPRKLTDAAKVFLDRDHVGAHGALEDIRISRDVIAAQLERWPRVLPREMTRLHEAQFPKNPYAIDGGARFVWNEQGEATIGFGKHKGTPLRTLDRGYLKWMLGQDFTPECQAIIRNALNGAYPTKEQTDAA